MNNSDLRVVDAICKNCNNYSKDDTYVGFGNCSEIEDSNEYDLPLKIQTTGEKIGDWSINKSKIYTSDYEGYSSGHFVGENFGCIHFEVIK